MNPKVIVYGSTWCGHNNHALKRLEAFGVPYRFVDVDANPEAEARIAEWNAGRAIRPTLDIAGEIFVHPDDTTLFGELKKRGYLATTLKPCQGCQA